MTDVHNKETRSYNMSRIRGKDTKPELLVRKFLFSKGFRFRLHAKNLPGKPDIVLPKYRTVIFVHGCYWHGHEGCRYFKWPKTRTEWWREKIMSNKLHDEDTLLKLLKKGWRVISIFECELKPKVSYLTLDQLIKNLTHDYTNQEP
ncbi:MAG: DNA mismatch endonuclease Vsr [Bacteroidetes bacterium]|nr:DNA mismatch endonuclease Vsr [Bacteroidota bacterium]